MQIIVTGYFKYLLIVCVEGVMGRVVVEFSAFNFYICENFTYEEDYTTIDPSRGDN